MSNVFYNNDLAVEVQEISRIKDLFNDVIKIPDLLYKLSYDDLMKIDKYLDDCIEALDKKISELKKQSL